MKSVAIFAGALCLFLSEQSSAETFLAAAESHDFKSGPAIIRKSFDDDFSGNSSFSYESFGCTRSDSLSEIDDRRDARPVRIDRIMLLGTEKQAPFDPAYLVAGTRMIWIAQGGSSSEFVELPCTWIVAFDGNKVRSVREATELSYLIAGSDSD